ncbi:MAG: asparagine synthase (glutamine-hydrolyzing) [Desulfobacteraceae bacterium]|nr:asparagine synthase (glutamine-hydrolyzing) [Desulfobacteraceae bacterium]
MCGIAGIVSARHSMAHLSRQVQEMGCTQKHRGPDGRDFHAAGVGGLNIALGFVRLAILDLETGMQPICCPTDDTAIVCNGQIYNYIELRPEVADQPFVSSGDVEVALHLYRRHGIEFLHRLNGMYAGALLDPKKAKLFLFRDRFGIKPLYYTEANGAFAFASEIKPLLAGLEITPQLNTDRLASYFVYRYVPGEQTMFDGIYRLPPGAYLEYDLNAREIAIHQYWNYITGPQDTDLDLQSAADGFFDIFRDAVRIRLRSDVELGSFISGGIDSSAVAAAAVGTHPDMRLYTASFDEPAYDELPDVRRFLQTRSRWFSQTRLQPAVCGKDSLEGLADIIAAVEEPISLGTILPTDCVCRAAAADVKAVLTGEGADEIFAGYKKFMIEMAAEQYSRMTAAEQARVNRHYPELENYLATRSHDPARRYIQAEALFDSAELKRLLGSTPDQPVFPAEAAPALTGREHPVNTAISFESRCRLTDYVILRLDKLSMRHGLETRTPFLDYRLAEFAARLPVSMKVNLGLNREKLICAYSFVRHGLLDAKTAFRKKQPFTFPMADWLSEPRTLPEPIREVVLGNLVQQHNVLDPGFVRRLSDNVTAAGVGPQTLVSQADRLFSVIVFTLWYQHFMRDYQNFRTREDN